MLEENNKQSSLYIKKILRPVLPIIILSGLSFSLALIYHLNNTKNSIKNEPVLLVENFVPIQEKIVFSLPILLTIPKITVDAVVEYVGLTLDERMDVPKGPAEVAWFKLGVRPGQEGSAVMAGHSGFKNGVSAVFDDLHKLNKGDKIYVKDDKGEVITFVVSKTHIYGSKENAPEVFNSNDGKAHLNLVTCTGIWSKIDKSHSDRLVVFTDRE